MCAKHAAECLRGVRYILRRLDTSDSLFGLVVFLSAISAFFLGYSRSPPARPTDNLPDTEAGPSSFILNETVSRASLIDRDEAYTLDDRAKVNILIGIFTAADGESGDYGRRRKAIRETYLPDLQSMPGIVAKFVVGHVTDESLANAASAEQSRYASSFLNVDVEDCVSCGGVRACSSCLIEKTLAFYRAAYARFDARWVIKADDDVYLSPLRLSAAAAQWNRMGAEYVGCMKNGVVQDTEDHRWYEPAALLLGSKYYLHAMGAVYVVAGHVVSDALVPNAHLLRRLSFEDTTMGLWMLAFNVTFFEDKRICQPRCHSHAVAFLDNSCQEGCDASQSLRSIHGNILCTKDIPNGGPLRYLPSGPGHGSFDAMRVLV